MIDNEKYIPRALKVLDIIQQSHGAIELNTAGWFKNCDEPYPAAVLLPAAANRNIPVVISADAHHADHLQRAFDRAAELLNSAGYLA